MFAKFTISFELLFKGKSYSAYTGGAMKKMHF